MDVCIEPAPLTGRISAIASKSDAHRLAICAAFGSGTTTLSMSTTSVDIETTLDCLEALGAKIVRGKGFVEISPLVPTKTPHLNCMESGSTFRFMLPVAAAVSANVSFTGCGRLPERPIGELRCAMEDHGVVFSAQTLPFTTKGTLNSGAFALAGNVSSQYITGLLMALSTLKDDSTLTLTTPLQSGAYVDITLHALRRFGVAIARTDTGYFISGGQSFVSPKKLAVDGDWSNAAFFLVAGAIGQAVTVTGLDMDSPQGDKGILEILRQFGAKVTIEGDAITVSPAPLQGCTIDIDDMPDSLPILAVLATFAQGETHFVNAARLRLKESDRLVSTAAMLQNLGAKAEERPEGLTVYQSDLTGGRVDSFQDHRIAMAAAVGAIGCTRSVTITNAGAVSKSYPAFYEDYNRLGGKSHVV